MVKTYQKAYLILSLFFIQLSSVHAGMPTNYDPKGAAITFGVMGIGVGAITALTLGKSYQWARNETGAKRYVGISFLATTFATSFIGIGYLLAKSK